MTQQVMGERRTTVVVLGVVAGILLLLAIIGVVARQATTSNQVLIVFAALFPLLLMPAVASLLLFALTRSWAGVLTAASIVAVIIVMQLPLAGGSALPPAGAGATPLVVMTSNLDGGRADATSLVARVRAEGVQVLALQEVTDEAAVRLRAAGIDDVLPYSVIAPGPGADGSGLWSAFPLSGATVERDLSMHRVWARMTVDSRHPERDLTVASLHIVAPWPTSPESWLVEMTGLGTQLQTLRGRVVALGDFNATWDHAPFRALLVCGYSDAVESSGGGWVPTYPSYAGSRPLIGIDHVISRGVASTRAYSVPVVGSDHRGLIAELAGA